MTICRVKNPEEGIEFAFNFLVNLLEKSEVFKLCISGGKTPEFLFKKLNDYCYSKKISSSKIKVCWVDERNVSYASERSNYGNAKKVFPYLDKLQHVPIPTSKNTAEILEKYLNLLTEHGFIENNEFVADLSILGMGADGHTASIFPNTELKFSNKFVAISEPENMLEARITLLPKAINNSKEKMAIVFGRDKKNILKECILGNENYPFTSLIQNTLVITDQDV